MRTAILTFAAALALAACDPITGYAPVEPTAAPAPRPGTGAPGGLNEDIRDYYAQVERNFRARGLMRTDGGGRDSPFSTRDVVESFMQIAFYSEYADRGGRLVAQQTASRMQRWERPVNIGIVAGTSVTTEQLARDRANIAGFARRLAGTTRHPITTVDDIGNFTVLILSEDERRGYARELSALMPGLSRGTMDAIVNMPTTVYCLVVARDTGNSNAYVQAVAVIRAEHPDLMRLSCIHEEIAQGLGLANDSPRARPSVFNDDEEFALLTRMDDILLRILYDPRLRPGMTEDEARPIVETIAAEIMGGPA